LDRIFGNDGSDGLLVSESYGYDADGNLTAHTDRNGNGTAYLYDQLDRRTFARLGDDPSGREGLGKRRISGRQPYSQPSRALNGKRTNLHRKYRADGPAPDGAQSGRRFPRLQAHFQVPLYCRRLNTIEKRDTGSLLPARETCRIIRKIGTANSTARHGTRRPRKCISAVSTENTMDRDNNFDSIRLIAATTVIFSHSFLLADQNELREPFVKLLGAHNILGLYGVLVFFIISGYFVTRSYLNSASPIEFLQKRFLRIFPGLIVCAFILTFVIAPLFFNGSFASYYLSADPYRYFLRTIFLQQPGWPNISGVNFYDLKCGSILNGSLWSIQSEVLCYAIVFFLGICGLLNVRTSVALLAFGMLSNHYFNGGNVFVLPAFSAGMVMFFVREKYKFQVKGVLAIVTLIALIVGGMSGYLRDVAFPIFGAYAIICLGFTRTFSLGRGAKFGDLSYGTYIYGWPVEQCVRAACGDGAMWWKVFLMSLPITLLLGFLSWHMVEKVALRRRSLPDWLEAACRRIPVLVSRVAP
jgi:YD repeat-containing protein